MTVHDPVARVVPDVTGLDRAFDYLIPAHLAEKVRPGCVVRVPLHGRTVKGWVVSRSDETHPVGDRLGEPFHEGTLQQIIDVRGTGVSGELIPVAAWSAERWSGPLRAVLVAASAPRLRDLAGSAQYRLVPRDADSTTGGQDDRSGRPVGVQLHVSAPQRPVIALALEAAASGPVLLLCPTVEMARRGAAWLRRHGAVVAEHPQDWSRAAGGVDIVVGARSAVWAPVPRLRTVMVIDEHDTAYVNERSPHWDAGGVGERRASLAGARTILSSPVPSLARVAELDGGAVSLHESSDHTGWGRVDLVDLSDDRENGGVPSTLVSSTLLDACRDVSLRIGVVLNSRDEAAAVSCPACAAQVTCPECAAPMRRGTSGNLSCTLCALERPAICGTCGSTKLRAARTGFKALASSIQKAIRRDVATVSATDETVRPGAGIFVGTEALLHRVHPLDVVVVADADAWLGSSRLGASERLWALCARALRSGGTDGRLVLQTRRVDHRVMQALAATGRDGADAYLAWARSELATRRELALPPLVPSALFTPAAGSRDDAHLSAIRTAVERATPGVRHAPVPDGVLVLASDRDELDACIAAVRAESPQCRVVVDPRDL